MQLNNKLHIECSHCSVKLIEDTIVGKSELEPVFSAHLYNLRLEETHFINLSDPLLLMLACNITCIENCGSFIVSAVTIMFTYSDYRYCSFEIASIGIRWISELQLSSDVYQVQEADTSLIMVP